MSLFSIPTENAHFFGHPTNLPIHVHAFKTRHVMKGVECDFAKKAYFSASGATMLETKFQGLIVKEIEDTLDGVIIMKNDANRRMGIPDMGIFFGNRYAILEFKKDAYAPYQPLQEYYLGVFKSWDVFSATIYPENAHEVLSGLYEYFS